MNMNLKRGDRIGIWGPNSYEWILTQWAASRAGLVLVCQVNNLLKAFFKVVVSNQIL